MATAQDLIVKVQMHHPQKSDLISQLNEEIKVYEDNIQIQKQVIEEIKNSIKYCEKRLKLAKEELERISK